MSSALSGDRRWFTASLPPSLPAWTLVGVALLTYGYEIFAFHLSVDEAIAGTRNTRSWAETWLGQGRWGQAVLTLLLPNAIGPVVTTALAVALIAASAWWLARRTVGLPVWPATLAVALAVSAPWGAFLLTFASNALGTGVGCVLCVVFADRAARRTWEGRAGAVLALAGAVGIYEPFAVAGPVALLAVVLARPSWRVLAEGAAITVLAVALSRAVGDLAAAVAGVERGDYTAGFFDLGGFLADPGGRLVEGLGRTTAVLAVTNGGVGTAAPWVWILLIVLAGLAVVRQARAAGDRAVRLVALGGALALPVLAAAVTVDTPVRTMVHVPFSWIVVVTAAFLPTASAASGPTERRVVQALTAFGVVGVLAVASQAIATNRVLVAGDTVLAHDRSLAFRIEERRARLAGADTETPVVLSAVGFAWPESRLAPRRETVGQSSLNGDTTRAAAFLMAEGVRVRPPTTAEAETGEAALATMPTYPEPGWIAYRDGVLLVKLTPDLR